MVMRIAGVVAGTIEGLSTLACQLGGLAVFSMMVLITFEVAYRFLTARSTLMAEEFGGFLLLLVTFLPLADLMRRRGHIVVDLVIQRIADAVVVWLRLVTYLLGLGYVTVVLWQAVVFQNQVATLGRKSLVTLFPFAYVQPFMIIGLALLWLMILVLLVRHLRALIRPTMSEERSAAIERAHKPAAVEEI